MNLLPIALLVGGIYIVSQQQKTRFKSTLPNWQIAFGFKYDCKSLKVDDPTAFKNFVRGAEHKAFTALNISISNIFDFSDYVIPYVKNVINIIRFNDINKVACNPKTLNQNEKILYYILGAEAIDDLIKMKLGNELDIDSEEVQKWKDVSDSYYDILADYLDLHGKELEINAAHEKLMTESKFP